MKRRDLVVIGAAPAVAAAQQHEHRGAAAPAAGPAKLKFFSKSQHALVDELTEMLLPADQHSGGAKKAKVAAFIDEVVAGAGAESQKAWTDGLAAVDTEARRRFRKAFTACSQTQRDQILKAMAEAEEAPQTALQHFFVRLKTQTISGYYTSSVGLLEDLQYKGIVPIASYPACTHPEHQKAER